jgi:RNA polymerase-binding transcription factor DksA
LRLIRAIQDALTRIRHGTFGTCEACRKPISRARLEAVPWTRHCRDCKEHEHSLHDETSKNATGSSAW